MATLESKSQNLFEVARLFLKLGLTAFGGPAAHVAMFHDEVVTRRKWMDNQHFLDLLGATNLIPGPNSTEMAIHVGFSRAGWPGLFLSGACFILPAMVLVTTLAWAYVRFGSTPQVNWILYGVKPIVIAIILQALWKLGQKAVKGPITAFVGILALGLYFFGINPIVILISIGLVVMLVQNYDQIKNARATHFIFPLAAMSLPTIGGVPFGLGLMFLTFLKIGAVLYGSGYVLLAFLHADFVARLGWLSDQQLVDAIAIGQVTPGPVFTTATFIGYLLGGLPGAILGTVGIFLPSFILVALSNPIIPRLRRSPWAGGLLDGVNVASLGLMAAVTWQLGQTSIVDIPTVLIWVITTILLFRYKINTTWLVFGGAILGLLFAGIN